MWEVLITAIADNLEVFLVGVFSLASGSLGYFLSKQLADRQRKYENQARKEDRYLSLLGKFNVYLAVFSSTILEASLESDQSKKDELIKKAKEKMSDFSETKAIVEIFGTERMNHLVEQIGREAQNMAKETVEIYRKTGRLITEIRELESGKNFFSRKVELIDEIKKNLGQPVSKNN